MRRRKERKESAFKEKGRKESAENAKTGEIPLKAASAKRRNATRNARRPLKRLMERAKR